MNNSLQQSRSRRYAQAFSRGVFSDLLRWGNSDILNKICLQSSMVNGETYLDYLGHFYQSLKQYYRCEYVFKNEIIRELKKKYNKKKALVINEFRVNSSIVDIALFNGQSCAFEIKTSYDSPRRLLNQLSDYKTLFDKCYLVVEECEVKEWVKLDDKIGVIAFCHGPRGKIYFETIREAQLNDSLDVNSLMSCLRASEYERIAMDYGHALLNSPSYKHYSECKGVLMGIDPKTLRHAFLETIEKRKTSFDLLRKVPHELYQICISMQLSNSQIGALNVMLNNKVSL